MRVFTAAFGDGDLLPGTRWSTCAITLPSLQVLADAHGGVRILGELRLPCAAAAPETALRVKRLARRRSLRVARAHGRSRRAWCAPSLRGRRGTLEFWQFDRDGDFFFMEMNTAAGRARGHRSHHWPDLVEWQCAWPPGERLDEPSDLVPITPHAIEVRLTVVRTWPPASAADRQRWRSPAGYGVRARGPCAGRLWRRVAALRPDGGQAGGPTWPYARRRAYEAAARSAAGHGAAGRDHQPQQTSRSGHAGAPGLAAAWSCTGALVRTLVRRQDGAGRSH